MRSSYVTQAPFSYLPTISRCAYPVLAKWTSAPTASKDSSIFPGLTQRDNLEKRSGWPNQYPETGRPKRENEKMRNEKWIEKWWVDVKNEKHVFPHLPPWFLKTLNGSSSRSWIIQNQPKSMTTETKEKLRTHKDTIKYISWILHSCFAHPFVMFLEFLAPDWPLRNPKQGFKASEGLYKIPNCSNLGCPPGTTFLNPCFGFCSGITSL